MARKRKHFNGAAKVSVLRRHLLDHVAVSDVCDELGLAPTVFYRWQKEFIRISGMPHVKPPLLPPIQRQDRAMAQVCQDRKHPAQDAIGPR